MSHERDDAPRRDDRRPSRPERGGSHGRGERRPSGGDDRRPRREGDDRRPRREGDDRRPRREGDDRRPRREGDDRQARPDWKNRPPRVPEPQIPDDIEAGDLAKVLRSELLTLSKDNAEGVARHLVAVGRALDAEEFDLALEHAQAAAKRAGRVAGVRETLGVVHYRRQEWAAALGEFRTARRISGLDHLLPLMADAERGLGRPERALELANTAEARRLAPAEQIELAVVVSGARVDMGQPAAAVQHLRELATSGSPRAPWAARLRYAYATALEADGQHEEARSWLEKAAALDVAEETDARELLGMDEAPVFVDLTGDVEPEPPVAGDETDTGADRSAGGAHPAAPPVSGTGEGGPAGSRTHGRRP